MQKWNSDLPKSMMGKWLELGLKIVAWLKNQYLIYLLQYKYIL